MHATEQADLNGWIADIGTVLARVALPDPADITARYRTGTVMLAFTIELDGGIADIRIVGSSGDDGLDRRAVAKLRRAEPLPAGPVGASRRTQVVAMHVAERTPARAPQPVERAYA